MVVDPAVRADPLFLRDVARGLEEGVAHGSVLEERVTGEDVVLLDGPGGAGLLQPGGRRQIEVLIPDGIHPRVNDRVEVSLAPGNLLQAAVTVYGFPLTGGLAGAAFAYALVLGDSAAAVAALLGVGAGIAASRWRLRQGPCLGSLTPTIARLC